MKKNGQVMLLTTAIIGGVILGTATLSGFLMRYQIRQATNVVFSAKAIFAADTGIEWELYKFFKNPNYPKPTMTNGADFATSRQVNLIRSIGQFQGIFRAFELSFK